MTVKELIEKLKDAPQDAEIWVSPYNTGGAGFGYDVGDHGDEVVLLESDNGW